MEIRALDAADRESMLAVINAAALAYRGVIPADVWRQPYMPRQELEAEVADGIAFWGVGEAGGLQGVMGIQDKGEVTLIRHAYVAPHAQRAGIGSRLLRHVLALTRKPVLVGTWAAASWAIAFYRRHGFVQVAADDKDMLLRRYWSVPPRQIETSIVLADRRWLDSRPGADSG